MKVVSTVFITTVSLVAIYLVQSVFHLYFSLMHTVMTLAFIYLCLALNTVLMTEELVCLSANYLHLCRSL